MTTVEWGDDRGYLAQRLYAPRVAVPVYYNPDRENDAAWTAVFEEIDTIRRSRPAPAQAPPVPPGTITVPSRAEPDSLHVLCFDATLWREWIARMVAAAWENCHHMTLWSRGLPEVTLPDLHTGVEWTIHVDPDRGSWSSYAFAGRPAASYRVELPIDGARYLHTRPLVEERYLAQLHPVVSL